MLCCWGVDALVLRKYLTRGISLRPWRACRGPYVVRRLQQASRGRHRYLRLDRVAEIAGSCSESIARICCPLQESDCFLSLCMDSLLMRDRRRFFQGVFQPNLRRTHVCNARSSDMVPLRAFSAVANLLSTFAAIEHSVMRRGWADRDFSLVRARGSRPL